MFGKEFRDFSTRHYSFSSGADSAPGAGAASN